ncbi:hypothetical protein QBC43DRAFT_323868 [Cladorrhinum sp. PSN259]|nr:hypothetical protein QBC43DRAFT_323868 [Cladorrhinum sp. PSN259]
MEKAVFTAALESRKELIEQTSWLEMLNYTDASLDTVNVDEHRFFESLEDGTFEDFLHRRGRFAQEPLPSGVSLKAGLRLIVQLGAEDRETFSPNNLSLPKASYAAMVEAFHLPKLAIETASAVGPFFWFSLVDRDGQSPRMDMVFRKSDIRRNGCTRGWELTLSHELKTGMTQGFLKGTHSVELPDVINLLKSCGPEIGHPLLLPMIMFRKQSTGFRSDHPQRSAREWLQRIEQVITMRQASSDLPDCYTNDSELDISALNRDLVECHAQVLWQRPAAYLAIVDSVERAARLFMDAVPEGRMRASHPNDLERFQETLVSRLFLYRKMWEGIEVYANTTLQRLEMQRNALYNIMAQRDNRVNLELAHDQRRLAHTSKRESEAMKGISLLGAVFLPGAFLSSIFSTTFFDFKDATDWASTVSPRFWLYYAVGIPFTLAVVALYFVWERRRARRYAAEDADIEDDLGKMEVRIMQALRRRTMNKARTYGERLERRQQLAANEENDFGASMEVAEQVPAITSSAATF